jgi:exodeoxyribonuclease V alpha subunit
MIPLAAEVIAALRAQALVHAASAPPSGPVPFVLDDAGRFYLWRNHANESAVVDAVRARLATAATAPIDEARVDALFPGQQGEAVAPQRAAVRGVSGRRLFVLTGGPGTGKTTTVLRMLLMLQRQAAAPLSIQVAAPTGKAAQRLVQSLRKGKQDLLRHATAPLPPDWHDALAGIPDHEALTLHRLLGYQPFDNTFRRGAGDPIAADVVVVDEASMVDLAMLRSLLDAVRPEATLILVGDADQLASVAAGSVLRDLVDALDDAGEASGVLVRLRHSFRAEHELVAINEAIRRGDAAAMRAAFAAAGPHALRQPVDDEAMLARALQHWARAIAATAELRPHPAAVVDVDALPAPEDGAPETAIVAAALDALAHRQLLCARREGPYGSVAANAVLERLLRKAWDEEPAREWYPGRAVIVTRNDYALGLFNGDIGLCLADAGGHLRVWFEAGARAGAQGEAVRTFRSVAPNALPAHEPAFAITIHKSQGSEYDHVAVLLPPDADSRILSRQLLYTGASRARRKLEVWAGDAALAAALATAVRRSGGLAARLQSQPI